MTTKQIQNKYQLFLINLIMEKALNPPPGFDVFVRYAGHIKQISVSVHKDAKYEEDADHNVIYSKDVWLKFGNSSDELNEILNEIEIILTGNEER